MVPLLAGWSPVSYNRPQSVRLDQRQNTHTHARKVTYLDFVHRYLRLLRSLRVDSTERVKNQNTVRRYNQYWSYKDSSLCHVRDSYFLFPVYT